MYRAKNSGRNRFQIFSAELGEKARRAKIIEAGLLQALSDGGLAVQYQPQFGLSGGIVGLEALCRFQAPELGPVSPAEFIPIAEESGLIVPIGRWVLQEVCRQMMEWQASGVRPLKVAVNVSVAQLTRADFVDQVGQILQQSGLDPCLLELELTESLLMLNLEAVTQHMTDLRKLGIRFSIDDFGAGYSSLGYLHKLPIDLVKIDRCFISDLDAAASSRPVIESILALARNLRLGVIAEGVESISQYSALCGLGCTLFQGFLFARPMNASEVVRLISDKYLLELSEANRSHVTVPPKITKDTATGDLVQLALHL
jgi:EAL domain-containing protein (putative c-di-GMP-specific phosphodiesterase class I)